MNQLQRNNIIWKLPIILIFSLLISCNAISHKERPVSLWKQYYHKPPHFDRDYCDPTYKVVENYIGKQRKQNYVICIQYVWNHFEYNQGLDFVWSIPETKYNRIKLRIYYSPDLKRDLKVKRIEDQYVYHGSLAWLRDIGYDTTWHHRLNYYVFSNVGSTVFNPMEIDLYYREIQLMTN